MNFVSCLEILKILKDIYRLHHICFR